jgi:hypothetical protein
MIGILPVAYQILQLHKNYNDWYITCSLSDFTIAQKLQTGNTPIMLEVFFVLFLFSA